MSYKSSMVKMAINNSPTKVILWLANKKLKGIAKIIDFSINTEEWTFYVQVLLFGEQEPIEVWLEEVELIANEQPYALVIQKVRSTKPWLEAVLCRAILGRQLDIPEHRSELILDLFANTES